MITVQDALLFTVTWFVMAVVYKIFLAKLQAPVLKRWYILVSALLALGLTFASWFRLDNTPITGAVGLPTITITNLAQPQGVTQSTSWLVWLFAIAGVYIIVRTVQALMHIIRVKKQAAIKVVNGSRVYINPTISGPFTFFNWVFLPNESIETEVLQHEKLHAQLGHSYDILFWELLKCLLWWHPSWWIFRSEMELNHENHVDLLLTNPTGTYASTLIKYATRQWSIPLSAPLAKKSQLQQRIAMMHKKSNGVRNGLAAFIALVFTVMCTTVLQTSCTREDLKRSTPTANPAQIEQEENAATVVDEMPTFPGGTKALFAYMQNNIQYSESLKENEVEGVVFVSFIVDIDGSIRDVELLQGIAEEADQQALEMVAAMPNWNPGYQKGKAVPVKYNLPIRFSLE